MEKLNEETGKFTDAATKFTDEAGKIVLDRFKNPYISTFLISWLLFNWRPISFFIFSKGTVEYKILLISQEYSNALNYFVYPFLTTILYLFALPYLNQANEFFLQKSVKHRANFEKKKVLLKITNDKEIAIADDEKQKAIAVAKESTNHNKFVEEMQNSIENLQSHLNDERLKNQKLINDYEEKLKLQIDAQKTFTDLNNEEIVKLVNKLSETEKDNKKLLEREENLRKEYGDSFRQLKIERFINERYRQPYNKIIYTHTDTILEYFNDLNEIRYFDVVRKELISRGKAYDLIDRREIEANYTAEELENAIWSMQKTIGNK
ncbi:hypothetical protein [Chryseobacterium sp. RLHN22]|uniref:hypothetical protein n=1 Tax=Chryseobacterium sp. RLHN22 TaxID=3437885 RepID=UPI003D9B89E9